MTAAVLSGYASLMSPRSARDASAIKVEIHAAGIGSGRPEEGGGPLRGGLTLMNRFTADITDPGSPHDVTIVVAARDGWLACEALTIRARSGGEPVTGVTLRSVLLGLYMQRVRTELVRALGGMLIVKKEEHRAYITYGMPANPAEWEQFDIAQLRRATRLTPELAAEAYREALASPDPDQRGRPTVAAAEKLGVSRGHVSRLITEARKKGIEGLGPGRPARRKKG